MGKIAERFSKRLAERRRKVTITGGMTITFRQFRKREMVWAYETAQPIIEDMHRLMIAAGGALTEEGVAFLWERHPDAWFALIARATGRPAHFFEELPFITALCLVGEFFGFNKPFFLNGAAVMEVRARTMPA